MNDFAFTHDHRWIGNYVVSIACLLVLFAFALRKSRPSWLTGAAILAALFVILFVSAAVMEHRSPTITIGWGPRFSLPFVVTYFSALPIQEPCNWLLGEDNIFEEHLMIPTALLMWSVVGAALGSLKAKLWNRGTKAKPQ